MQPGGSKSVWSTKEGRGGPFRGQSAEYGERLRYELKVIQDMGFSGTSSSWPISSIMRAAGIPVGPGRAPLRALSCLCLGITTWTPSSTGSSLSDSESQRISMPDIDIDFCINGRDEVIRYVAEKYGRENVSQIITFGTMKARAVSGMWAEA